MTKVYLAVLRLPVALLFCLSVFVVQSGAVETEFPGWQGLRVVEQKGRPYRIHRGEIDGRAGDELIVVNYRSSRLDIYSWLPPAERKDSDDSQPGQPNDLPMAPDIRQRELQLERVPRDLLLHDLDNDGTAELIILVSPPNQLLVFRSDSESGWVEQSKHDLLEADVSSRRSSLLAREVESGSLQVLVNCDEGIQKIVLKPGARAEWLTPREEQSRKKWWLADFDGDGHDDLVEQTGDSDAPIRWYQGSDDGRLAPAAALYDRSVSDAQLFRTSEHVELALLDGSVRQLLRRYRLELGDPSDFGRQRPLAMDEASKTAWCGMWQGDDRALVVADRKRPQLLCHALDDNGWSEQKSFPAVSGIEKLVSPAAEAGTVLIWAKDASDLLVSQWKSDRLTYPLPDVRSGDSEDRKILALDAVGSTTWWVQKVGKHLDLYRWPKEAAEATVLRFEGVGSKANEVLWIGGDRLLVKDTHSRALKFVSVVEGKTKVSSPTHLKKANLSQYKLVDLGEELRLARMVEGVLQWIGDDLLSHDQVMLPQGQELADYVAEGAGGGWALEQESPYLHRIKIESSGLSVAESRLKIVSGKQLVRDEVLGLLLVGHDRLTQLSAGRPLELKLIEAIDQRVAQNGGVKKTRFHRLGATDIDGDGYDEVLLYDDLEHRITALAENEDKLRPKISWPVFDDKVYPYGEEYDSLVQEPRAALALDLDGDGHRELALLSQDRLIIYLARDEP